MLNLFNYVVSRLFNDGGLEIGKHLDLLSSDSQTQTQNDGSNVIGQFMAIQKGPS